MVKTFRDPIPSKSQPMPVVPSASPYLFQPEPPKVWKRVAVGGLCTLLGLGAAGVGLTSIYYRLTHLTVKSGIVNGRTVRIQAPVDGTIQDFYGSPGAEVRAGQALARLDPLAEDVGRSPLPQLRRQEEEAAAELELAQQMLALLQRQQAALIQADKQVQQATVAVATNKLDQHQADLSAAIAEETAAQADYKRFQSLLDQGAVSAQQVDQLEASWKAAQAAVASARAEVKAGQTQLGAARRNIPMDLPNDDLQEQQAALTQQIQIQEAVAQQASLTLANRKAEVAELEGLDQDIDPVDVAAPFSGVVYTTHYEAGEQVSRPTTLLSLLDCNTLWVEAIIDGDRANHVDAAKPVRVQLLGRDQTLIGRVTVIEAVSAGELGRARAEAILPAIPPNLINQPLARVRVMIPATETQTQANQFCGVGQNAQLTFGMQAWRML